MAKLSAHGKEIGRIEYLTYTKAYFSDGRVLKNSGFGWKLHAKIKDGFLIQNAYDKAVQIHKAFIVDRPAFAAFEKELHSMAGLSKRWKLRAALEIMSNDPDGVWSECCDGYGDNVSASIEDVVKLCRLYDAAMLERNALNVKG